MCKYCTNMANGLCDDWCGQTFNHLGMKLKDFMIKTQSKVCQSQRTVEQRHKSIDTSFIWHFLTCLRCFGCTWLTWYTFDIDPYLILRLIWLQKHCTVGQSNMRPDFSTLESYWSWGAVENNTIHAAEQFARNVCSDVFDRPTQSVAGWRGAVMQEGWAGFSI